MKFLVDNQLPVALSRHLRTRGCDCAHVDEIGLSTASDKEIWSYATENACAVVSKDEDFLFLAISTEGPARFVWVRFGNCRTAALLKSVDRLWQQVERSIESGERVIELR